jgi:hypothetical protein
MVAMNRVSTISWIALGRGSDYSGRQVSDDAEDNFLSQFVCCLSIHSILLLMIA